MNGKTAQGGTDTFPIDGCVALVTGANRGMGRQFVSQLIDRGAAKVYAGVRNPENADIPGATVLQLDITAHDRVASVAGEASDIDLLINNAGMSSSQELVTGSLHGIRQEMETNFFGTLSVVRAFAPVLKASGGGAVLNMLSALSWFSIPGSEGYAASKSAAWSLTNGIRLELQEQGTLVTGLHVGAVRTDMVAGYEGPMEEPEDVVRHALDGLAAGDLEVVADDFARGVKASLAGDPRVFYDALSQMLAKA